MAVYMRALCERTANTETGSGPIRFVASTEGEKRDGKDLRIDHWDLLNYSKNPIFLWCHDYMGKNLPIGKSRTLIENKKLIADVTFDQSDEFARAVESKYRRGYLNAVSVGWDDYANCPNCKSKINGFFSNVSKVLRMNCPKCGKEMPKEIDVYYELLDISGVPVPGDPDALIERQKLGRLLYGDDYPSRDRCLTDDQVHAYFENIKANLDLAIIRQEIDILVQEYKKAKR